MNKIFLISISLLVLFVAVASASAADVNSAVGDNCTCVVDGDAVVVDVNDTVSQDVDVVDVADVNDTASQDVDVVDVADVNDTASQDVAASVSHDAVPNVVEVKNVDHLVDSAASGGVCFDIHHFDKDHPDHVKITKEKRDSLKSEIDKYTKHLKKNVFVQLTKDCNGPRYGIFEFILDVYKDHEYDDTIIIVHQALDNCGYFGSEYQIEKIMNQMRSGTLVVNHYNYSADHYKSEIISIELGKVYNAWKSQMNGK